MQLEHSFTVPVGVDEAWSTLTDIERVVPCMPGAALESVEGDGLTGSVKVKVGPITLTYKGRAEWIERDEAAHRASMRAQGKDPRGNSTAAATVSMSLHMADDGSPGTLVRVVTDLDITGRPAQFGRGVMVDVGNKLIGQFADCLAKMTSVVEPVETESVVEPVEATSSKDGFDGLNQRVVEPIDLVSAAGSAIAGRFAPALLGTVGVALAILALVYWIKRDRRAGTRRRPR